MLALGYPGLVLIMVVENVFPPIPSEVVLPLAGFLSHADRGVFQLPLVVLAGALGSVLGALLLYAFGAWTRDHGGRRALLAAGRYVFLTEKDLDRAEDWFARYRALAVFTGRFVPVVRSLISIPAGYDGMPLPQFLALTAIGTTIWCAILASAGWVLGANWPLVRAVLSRYEQLVLVAGALAVVAFIAWRIRERVASRAG
ncbi:MAG: DedA family protein [Chloroflexi bacterium]|nr:DedA family protein [Chloroflexota bacterium]